MISLTVFVHVLVEVLFRPQTPEELIGCDLLQVAFLAGGAVNVGFRHFASMNRYFQSGNIL